MSDKENLAMARPSAFTPAQRKNKNEELETVRQEVLLEAASCRDTWHHADSELSRQLCRLHASWLCYKEGTDCLRTLCGVMPLCVSAATGDWKDLAGQLGLTNTQIMAITEKQSCANVDSVEFVIRAYSQNTNANLYHIVKSLQTLERFDALQRLKDYLQRLVDGVKLLIESDEANFICERLNPAEAGADSISSGGNEDGFLIAPKNYQQAIRRNLPKSLHNVLLPARNTEIVVRTNDTARPIIQQEHLVTRQNTASETLSRPVAAIRQTPRVNVFLTFAADGAPAAKRIARNMRAAVGDRPGFGVLVLDENAEKVLSNPEILINQLFPQFHFVCPILTLGYLQAINSPLIEEPDLDAQTELRSALDSLDAFYARFIHNLMMNEYTENNCRNKRFRCIIPKVDDNTQRRILDEIRQPGRLNPTLRAWAYEKDLESFLRRLIGLY